MDFAGAIGNILPPESRGEKRIALPTLDEGGVALVREVSRFAQVAASSVWVGTTQSLTSVSTSWPR